MQALAAPKNSIELTSDLEEKKGADDMQRHAIEVDAGPAGHAAILAL